MMVGVSTDCVLQVVTAKLILTVLEIAATFLPTAHIPEGTKGGIFPLNLLNTANRPTWLSSLQEPHHVDAMRLCEIDTNGEPVIATVAQKASEKVKQRDWLRLLLREFLGAGLPLPSDCSSTLS